MTTTTATNPMVEEYLARCSVLLWDLSPQLQTQLRDDIRQIVGEIAMELDGHPDDLVGPPLRFVSELRSAAGLPPIADRPHTPSPPRQPPAPDSAWLVLASVLLQLGRKVRAAAWPWTRQLLTDLRPAWWVARGIGLAFLLGGITGWYSQGLLPNLFDSQFLGLFSTVALVVLSVTHGRRGSSSKKAALVWLIASIVAFISLASWSDDVRYQDYGYVGYHGPVEIADHPDEHVFADSTFAEPVAPSVLTPVHEGITFNKEANGHVNFVDPLSGTVLVTVDPEDAFRAAEEMRSLSGDRELIVEFEGRQVRTTNPSDLTEAVDLLLR